MVVIAASGDEGHEYEQRLRRYADLLNVPVNFVSEIISDKRATLANGRKIYTLWDAYQTCDLVTYPSNIEGFGNAFLEALYFKRPILVNNYSIYAIDIKPKGFSVIEFDDFITDETVAHVQRVLDDPALVEQMTEQNYGLAQRYYSYTMLERRLQTLLMACFGEG
mgnify:CR=1 FL=1